MNERAWLFLFGEMAGNTKNVEDIPVSSQVDLGELKKGDDDPLEVVVAIPASKSTRGWNYSSNALKSIVDKVNESTLAGFLGHQKPENVSSEFLPPATHWVGAQMEGETAYFRGVVDARETNLKRWIRSGRVKQVSIFGRPKLEKIQGETHVTDYEAMSIDWTPLDRAGMKTGIVATSGEMWDAEGGGPQDQNKGGSGEMSPEEVLKEVKKMFGTKQLNMSMVAGEIGMGTEQIAGELDSEWLQKKTDAEKQLKEVSDALGVSGEMDVVQTAKEAAEAAEKHSEADFQKSVGEMMEKKVQSDEVKKNLNDEKTTLGRLWSYHRQSLKPDMTNDQLAGEMDKFLQDPVVAEMVSNQHTEQPAGTGGGNGSQTGTQPQAVRSRKSSI